MNALAAIQHWPLAAVAAIMAGTVALLIPRALNYAVAAYLLFIGALGLTRVLSGHSVSAESIVALIAGVLVLFKPEVVNVVVGAYLILIGLLQAGVLRV